MAGLPHKTAVIDQGQEMTFDTLARSAKNCAALILERTAALNRPIAVFLPKSASTIVAALGIIVSAALAMAE